MPLAHPDLLMNSRGFASEPPGEGSSQPTLWRCIRHFTGYGELYRCALSRKAIYAEMPSHRFRSLSHPDQPEVPVVGCNQSAWVKAASIIGNRDPKLLFVERHK